MIGLSWSRGTFPCPESMDPYHEISPAIRKIVVACQEVVVMNSLTVNLHLLMVTFYRPTQHDIRSFVSKSLPSDQYAFESQAITMDLIRPMPLLK